MRISGVYVLERLNGAAMPVILRSFATCPGPISYGDLSLGRTYAETPQLYSFAIQRARPCEPAGDPAEQPVIIGSDAGFWSVDGDRVAFKSVRANGFGTYQGRLRDSDDAGVAGPVIEFTIGGQAYIWRRVRGESDSLSSISISVFDQQGRFVNGVKLEFRENTGLVSYGTTNNDRPFGSGTVPGVTFTIHFRLPAGFSLAPGQAHPVTAVAGSTSEVIIRVIRASAP
ncbi:MAG: hypothetical protein H0U13_14605 [Gemmatimonadaceae bacterium]|nr:hypothetical protein [Gemmatimonadaceae bacterium]